MSKLVFASVISAIEQSPIFMTVKARVCEAPQANLNGARVTEAFIDEIVSNERYVGLPLYADKKALISGNYNRLGHLYDVKTGEFHSTQIGSFYKFEKQTNGENCYLIGYARIPKRNKKLSKAISELFGEGALKFSFELSVGEYEELDDDTILIDASENNYLEGTAIVTYPACEDAVAIELVAQQADEAKGGECEMAEVETTAEVVETDAIQPELAEEKVEEVETAETEKTEETTACKDKKNAEEEEDSEEETACKDKKQAEEETACKDKKEHAETATVYVDNHSVEVHEQCAYDSDTGKSVSQKVVVETHTSEPVDGQIVETVDGVHVAETVIAEPGEEGGDTETPAPVQEPSNPSELVEEPVSEPAEEETVVVDTEEKKTAEMIAELMKAIEGLKSEIAELKEQKATSVVGEFNPFMDTLKTEGKYSLLEKDEKVSSYSLLN